MSDGDEGRSLVYPFAFSFGRRFVVTLASVPDADALTPSQTGRGGPTMAEVLTSTDPEPSPGVVVRDDQGNLWRRSSVVEGRCWMPLDENGETANDDPETWTRVAGNFGPVTVTQSGRDHG